MPGVIGEVGVDEAIVVDSFIVVEPAINCYKPTIEGLPRLKEPNLQHSSRKIVIAKYTPQQLNKNKNKKYCFTLLPPGKTRTLARRRATIVEEPLKMRKEVSSRLVG